MAKTTSEAPGYVVDFTATEQGNLRCGECGSEHAPAEMQIDETVRYEGVTNPADETILLALDCECGKKGLFYAGFGINASTADARVLRNLP